MKWNYISHCLHPEREHHLCQSSHRINLFYHPICDNFDGPNSTGSLMQRSILYLPSLDRGSWRTCDRIPCATMLPPLACYSLSYSLYTLPQNSFTWSLAITLFVSLEVFLVFPLKPDKSRSTNPDKLDQFICALFSTLIEIKSLQK